MDVDCMILDVSGMCPPLMRFIECVFVFVFSMFLRIVYLFCFRNWFLSVCVTIVDNT